MGEVEEMMCVVWVGATMCFICSDFGKGSTSEADFVWIVMGLTRLLMGMNWATQSHNKITQTTSDRPTLTD